ncbi:h-sco1 [Atractiella rhizophila]|nr:h-sco1 [Atractiella rhizophila]
MQVFNFKALAIFLGTGAGLFLYFQNEKSKIEERKREEMAPKRMGRPNLGGPFELVDTKGNQYTDKDMLGKWSLVYFGFTNCPDICPEELDKMGHIVDYTREKQGTVITPLFITCDPARDSPQAIDAYLRDFHSSIIGLTGSYENIKTACKGYRVYFSSPPTAKPGDDYLVDHSIFFYLMDPEGKFVEAFGRSEGRERTRERVGKFIKEWEAGERWETS